MIAYVSESPPTSALESPPTAEHQPVVAVSSPRNFQRVLSSAGPSASDALASAEAAEADTRVTGQLPAPAALAEADRLVVRAVVLDRWDPDRDREAPET